MHVQTSEVHPPGFRAEAVELVISSQKSLGRGRSLSRHQRRNPGQLGPRLPHRAPRSGKRGTRTGGMGPVREAAQGTAGGETGERLFKRCQRLFRLEQQEISAVFTFIKAHSGEYPVKWMCQKLQVSRASYYRWLNPCEELSEVGPVLAQFFRPWSSPVSSVGALIDQLLVFGMPRSERGNSFCRSFLGPDLREFQAQTAQRLPCRQARIQGQVGAHVALDMHQAALDLHLRPEVLQCFHQP